MSVKDVIQELTTYALSLKGAQLEYGGEYTEDIATPRVMLPGQSWCDFFEVDHDNGGEPQVDGTFAKLPVYEKRLIELKQANPTIAQTGWMARDGHVQMAVPLDAELPIDFLKSLIDEAYEVVWNKVDEDNKFIYERAGESFDDHELLDELIDRHDLSDHRNEIHAIARPAILLKTNRAKEDDISVGATKIGGCPDLPPDTLWPTFENKQPLAFLAQIDLAEIAKFGTILNGLPNNGLLSLFSVWGWVTDDDSDPQTPNYNWKVQDGWTIALHTVAGQDLTRREAPGDVHVFPAAAVEPTLMHSLPNHQQEPPVAALNWSDETWDTFDTMQADYRCIQTIRWLKNMEGSYHLLGGYATFQQEYPEDLLPSGTSMLLQIGSDHNAGMCWGDDGELAFHANTEALGKGRFEDLFCDYQCA